MVFFCKWAVIIMAEDSCQHSAVHQWKSRKKPNIGYWLSAELLFKALSFLVVASLCQTLRIWNGDECVGIFWADLYQPMRATPAVSFNYLNILSNSLLTPSWSLFLIHTHLAFSFLTRYEPLPGWPVAPHRSPFCSHQSPVRSGQVGLIHILQRLRHL